MSACFPRAFPLDIAGGRFRRPAPAEGSGRTARMLEKKKSFKRKKKFEISAKFRRFLNHFSEKITIYLLKTFAFLRNSFKNSFESCENKKKSRNIKNVRNFSRKTVKRIGNFAKIRIGVGIIM